MGGKMQRLKRSSVVGHLGGALIIDDTMMQLPLPGWRGGWGQ
jgi:hypothetical protein